MMRAWLLALCIAVAGLPALPVPAAAAEGPFRRGINLTRLFDSPNLQPGPARDYATPVFKPWRGQVSEAELDRLRRAGFDFIRLPVDPGPLLEPGDAMRAGALAQIFDFLQAARARDLGVILDLHPRPDSKAWNAGAILASLDGPKFAALQRLIGELAGRLGALRDSRLALELLNEPQSECVRRTGPDWTRFQPRLVAAARAAAPTLNLVVTGGCYSKVEGLDALGPQAVAGPNMFLMIHFYEPHNFTHQGAVWSAPVRNLAGLSFPVAPGDREAALRAVDQLVDTRFDLSALRQAHDRAQARAKVEAYYRHPLTPADLRQRLGLAAAFADRAGLPRSHVIVGEFGVLRQGGIRLARDPEAAKTAWLSTVAKAAEALGFGWAIWAYDGAFGIVSEDAERVLEPATLRALFGPGAP